MKTTCIIVEDEPLALLRTTDYVNKTPTLHLLGCFDNAIDAITFLTQNSVDLIFLDIEMDELTGIEFLEATKVESEVIITTAYDEYAIKGFELNVLDYLLKPFPYSRFLQAVGKVSKKEQETVNHFFVKSGFQLEKIIFKDILYIEGMGDYRRIITTTSKVMTLHTFSDLLNHLPAADFRRVHKSYVVSMDKIKSIERNVVLISEERIPISAKYKDDFFNTINAIDKND